jgi:hypothetical protein
VAVWRTARTAAWAHRRDDEAGRGGEVAC